MRFLSLLFLLLVISRSGIAQQKPPYLKDASGKFIATRDYELSEQDNSKVFKRLKQFIALQKYDQVTEVPVKIGGSYVGPVVEKSILLEDAEDGKIYGDGYVPFSMKGRENFVLLFSYKIRISKGVIKFELSNFIVKEFVHLGISKGSMGAGQAIGYGVGTGKTKSGGADIRNYPLEDVIDKKGVEEQFLSFLKNFRSSFKKAIDGDL